MILARVLGRTMSELDRTMTADEYALWMAEWGDHPETLLGAMHVTTESEPAETPTPWEAQNNG